MFLYLAPAVLLLALMLGFLSGTVIYRQSRRWCTACGSTLACPACRAHLRQQLAQGSR
ncbi:MAG TPA: hypothetical protein VFC00_04860 [Micromonosporaceae bacterium]|nr:hypothetical protein [Micromonosporaceae bacterium]